MTRYKPQLEWVKELKLKGSIAQFLDGLSVQLGKMMENASLKDMAFVSTWASLSYLLIVSGTVKSLITTGIKMGETVVQLSQYSDIMMQGKYSQYLGEGSLAAWGLNIGQYIIDYFTGRVSQPTQQTIEVMETTTPPPTDYSLAIQIPLAMTLSYLILENGSDLVNAVKLLGAKL